MIPDNPKVYHLTHIRNLDGIFSCGRVYSDLQRRTMTPENTNIGISEIKRRRLENCQVLCHPGTMVGEYVPFYFCPRSIMLFLIYKGNHPDLNYTGGQNSIVFLQADLKRVIVWANDNGRKWAFSDRNAGAYYASFYCDISQLDKINWDAVDSADFRDVAIKEGKQAEFLLFESFPVELIENIGVINTSIKTAVETDIPEINKNIIVIKPEWYF